MKERKTKTEKQTVTQQTCMSKRNDLVDKSNKNLNFLRKHGKTIE